MSNFEIVMTYDDEYAEWLHQQGYPHPPVRPGNEMPTTADMKWALEAFDDLVFDYPAGEQELDVRVEGDATAGFDVRDFDWDESNTIPGDCFVVHGHTGTILSVLIKLCERCGQLLFYPDSGASDHPRRLPGCRRNLRALHGGR